MSPLSFNIISSVQDILDPYIYTNGPWVHLATVGRNLPGGGFREYVAFKKLYGMDVWIEELDMQGPCFSKELQDDQEWADAREFLREARLLEIGLDTEVRLGHKLAKYMEENYQDTNA